MIRFTKAALRAADEAMRDEVDRYERLGRPVSGRKVLRAALVAQEIGVPQVWREQFMRHERKGIFWRKELVPASGVLVDIYRDGDTYGFRRTVAADCDGWVEVHLPAGDYVAVAYGGRHPFSVPDRDPIDDVDDAVSGARREQRAPGFGGSA